MLVTLIRSLILYVLIVACMRLMGRRQIGELQPSELVITMMLSEIASIPLESSDIPLLNSITVILVLASLEVLLSVLCMKSDRTRRLLQGNPMPVVWDGKPIQKTMRQLRLTVDDLLEALREKDVFRITDVQCAILESNGRLTVQLRSRLQNVTPELLGMQVPPQGIPCPIIYDGKEQTKNFAYCGMTMERLQTILCQSGIRAQDVFLLTVDTQGNVHYIPKDDEKNA